MVLAREHDFALRLAYGTILRGWVVAAQGQRDEGLQQLRQGQHAYQATGAAYERPYLLALQAEVEAMSATAPRRSNRSQRRAQLSSIPASVDGKRNCTGCGENCG